MTIAELIRELMTLDPSLPVHRADSDRRIREIVTVDVIGERPSARPGAVAPLAPLAVVLR